MISPWNKSAPGTFAPSRTESPRRLFQRRFLAGLGGLTAAAGSSSPAPVSRGDGEPRCPVFGDFSHVFSFFSTFLRQTWHWKFYNKAYNWQCSAFLIGEIGGKGRFHGGILHWHFNETRGYLRNVLWFNHVPSPLLLVNFINWSE